MLEITQKLIKKLNSLSASAEEKIELLDLIEQIVGKKITEDKKITIKLKKITEIMDKLKADIKYLLFDKEANEREKEILQNRIDELEKEKNE